jgi:membrane-bound inhibitor of C-type lysozyme
MLSAIKRGLSAFFILAVTGCGGLSMKDIPLVGGSASSQAKVPANATEYQCTNGKKFYVRMLDGGATAWLIYPDRETALTKASSGNRYTNGVAVLEINGSEATLNDGPTIAYSGCKPPGAK